MVYSPVDNTCRSNDRATVDDTITMTDNILFPFISLKSFRTIF